MLDWNGTIQDDVRAAVNGTNAVLRDQGAPEISLERYREVFSFPARSCYGALGIRATDANWRALCDRFFSVFSSDPSIRLMPGARPALETLRAAGIGLSIVEAIQKSHHQDYGVYNAEDGVVFYYELDCADENAGENVTK